MGNAAFEIVKEHACFAGRQLFCRHVSEVLNCTMQFAVYLPPKSEVSCFSVLWFLSGLTCTEENFVIKAGAQRYAAEHNIILVSPDTSPRGSNTAGEDDDYALGTGAGFYLNATEQPWAKHYRMDDYICDELQGLIAAHFPIRSERQAITGFSMGGHGALVLGLRNPDLFPSVSALAPIAAPSQCPWGKNAFQAYLGDNRTLWQQYDATELVRHGARTAKIFIDQGGNDEFLADQLCPEIFCATCREAGQPVEYRLLPEYDHSFYFVASVIGDHIALHADRLAKL